MQNKLTYLIREEIDRKYKSTKEVSDKLRDLQRVYDALMPNKNKKEVISAGNLTEDLYYEFIAIINKYNYVLYNELQHLLNEARGLNLNGFTTSKSDFAEQSTVKTYRVLQDELAYQEKEAQIGSKMRDFFAYAVIYVVVLYEKLYDEKERKKEERKVYESTLKNLNRNRSLTPKEINAVTSLIERQKYDKNYYYDILNEYIRKKEIEVKILDEEEQKEEVKQDNKNVTLYKDEENKGMLFSGDEENDTLILNYLNAIETFKGDENNLVEFLDGISYNEDFDEILNKLIIITSEKMDNNFSDYLKRYRNELNNGETLDDNINDDITLLYYGFLQDKEKILNDIQKTIPKEDYKDILKALEQIKKDGAIANRKNIVRIRKVFKLRVGDIRVTFKRISKNVYIVLGIYKKKDNHGVQIIYSTERRNNHLLRYENQIIKSMKIDDLWDLYLEKNSGFEEKIFALLKQGTYKI